MTSPAEGGHRWIVSALDGAKLSFWVALLSVPQIVHYYLDAWIWRLDRHNPDMAEMLEEAPVARH